MYWQTETNLKTLPVFGPKNLIDLVASFRYSLWSPDFELKVSELSDTAVTVKGGVQVVPVVVSSSKSAPSSPKSPSRRMMMNPCFRDNILFAKSEATTDAERDDLDSTMQRVAQNVDAAQRKLDSAGSQPEEKSELGLFVSFDRPSMFLEPVPQHNVLSYVVQLGTLPPKVDAQKAKKLGVKGADLGKISRGEPVTVGEVLVQPEECWASAPKPGPCFIVACCPDVNYLDSVTSLEAWAPYYDAGREAVLACVVHLTPYAVLQTEKYSAWMKRFPAATQHILLDRDVCSTDDSNAKFQAFFSNLTQIDSEVFSVAKHTSDHFVRREFPPNIGRLLGEPSSKSRVIPGEVGMIFNLVPTATMGVVADASAASLPHGAKERVDYTQSDEKLRHLIDVYQGEAQAHRANVASRKNHYDIHLLGTGASAASSLRNEAGIYVDIAGFGGIIMDCGSHTYSQMARKFGTNTRQLLKRLKMVWISHRHPDHNAGLLHILVERQLAFDLDEEPVVPIVIVGPYWIEGKLIEYSLVSRHQLLFNYYHNSLFQTEDNPIKDFLMAELGISSFITTIVWHCRDAYGSCITSQDGWKIAYSGDCRPSDKFSEISKGADVMLHEATMCDEDQNLAVQKNHSCTCEAVGVARKAGVERILLTHFSKRQDSVPVHDFVVYQDEIARGEPCALTQEDISRVVIGFDMMTCKQRDLPVLPKLIPSLCRLHSVLGK